MDPIVFTAVLCAAAMHAGWNAIIKLNLEPLKAITLISIAYCILVAPLAPFVPLPVPEAWIYIAGSLAIHIVYYYALGEAYRTGDLGHVYPIARGTAPLLTAIGATFLLGEDISARGLAGIFMLTSGILLLSLKGGRKGAAFDHRGVGFAILCATSISAYTLVDGVGARTGPDPSGYIAWLMIFRRLHDAHFRPREMGAWSARPSRADMGADHGGRRHVARVIRHCAVGHDACADRTRCRSARNQRVVRGRDRRRLPA